MGVRVHLLAKELGMTSKELMAFLRTQGHNVKSHMVGIDENVASILRDRLKSKAPQEAEKEKEKKERDKDKAKGGKGKATTGVVSNGRKTAEVRKEGAVTPKPARREKRERKETTAKERSAPPAEGSRKQTGTRQAEATREGKAPESARPKGPRRMRYFPQDDYQARQPLGARRRSRLRADGGGRSDHDALLQLPEKIVAYAPVSVKDLSAALGVKAHVLIKKLIERGKPVTVNQYLDDETIFELGVDLGTEINVRKKEEKLEGVVRDLDEYKSDDKDLVARAPVVTLLGHVDHGKTSLLDKIRTTNVTSREEGGITQHLGAYRVDTENAHVTFIDTPGHKAFTEMRARGAHITDIAVLVVAADDGPMPQTEEAINHARAASVPIVVALNKIDKENANPQRCKEALSQLGLMPVEWNGTTEYVEVSALTGEGIDRLLETLSLEAEILELKADPKRSAVGVILEAEATTHRGVVATALIQDGTLRAGDYVLCGASHGRVRNLTVNGTREIPEAGPAMPVQITGLSDIPETGDKLYVFANERQARQLAEDRSLKSRVAERAERQQVTLENLFDRLSAEETPELRLILKADVRGSVEALRTSLEQLSQDEVKVVILHSAVGGVSQEDIHLASASDAVVIGFHVTADDRARALAEEEKVDVRHYRVIYEAIEDIKAALESRLAPEQVEEFHGRAEIRQVYRASRVGNIAGCMVTSGFVLRSDKVRLVRDGKIIYTGELGSLKRFKDDVREVKEGYECGMKIANYEDIKVGDVIEGFAVVEKQRNL